MSYFEDKIYIQTAYQGVRNKDILNVNTSSDFCVFESPSFTMIGADKIVTGTTSADTSIHIITTATTIDLTFTITANTESISTTDTTFQYKIHKLDLDSGLFTTKAQYISDGIPWSAFTNTAGSATTETINIDRLNIDGEYLIKNSFVHDVCTDFANRLGYKNDTSLFNTGDEYGLYNSKRDFYMSISRHADTPEFDPFGTNDTQIRVLRQQVIIPTEGQTYFIISSDIAGDFIVTVNGLVLSKDFDYSVSRYSGGTAPWTVTMSAETKSTDIVSFIYTASDTGSNGLKTDVIDVTSITSGATDGEGNNSVYYNTTTSMYEVFLSLVPTNADDILLMVNGATLANGIDYYQSITNPKRLILIGSILVGDIITIAYNQSADLVDSVNISSPTINWKISNAPTLVNGKFILEFSSDNAMTTQISSAETTYVVATNTYSLNSTISGAVGTELYYRVTNIKNYATISNDIIQTMAYSEIIPITIATNKINSY
jgi:hypothetical protein